VRSLGVPEPDVAIVVGLLSAASLLLGLPLVRSRAPGPIATARSWIVVRSAVVEAVLFLLIAFVSAPWQTVREARSRAV